MSFLNTLTFLYFSQVLSCLCALFPTVFLSSHIYFSFRDYMRTHYYTPPSSSSKNNKLNHHVRGSVRGGSLHRRTSSLNSSSKSISSLKRRVNPLLRRKEKWLNALVLACTVLFFVSYALSCWVLFLSKIQLLFALRLSCFAYMNVIAVTWQMGNYFKWCILILRLELAFWQSIHKYSSALLLSLCVFLFVHSLASLTTHYFLAQSAKEPVANTVNDERYFVCLYSVHISLGIWAESVDIIICILCTYWFTKPLVTIIHQNLRMSSISSTPTPMPTPSPASTIANAGRTKTIPDAKKMNKPSKMNKIRKMIKMHKTQSNESDDSSVVAPAVGRHSSSAITIANAHAHANHGRRRSSLYGSKLGVRVPSSATAATNNNNKMERQSSDESNTERDIDREEVSVSVSRSHSRSKSLSTSMNTLQLQMQAQHRRRTHSLNTANAKLIKLERLVLKYSICSGVSLVTTILIIGSTPFLNTGILLAIDFAINSCCIAFMSKWYERLYELCCCGVIRLVIRDKKQRQSLSTRRLHVHNNNNSNTKSNNKSVQQKQSGAGVSKKKTKKSEVNNNKNKKKQSALPIINNHSTHQQRSQRRSDADNDENSVIVHGRGHHHHHHSNNDDNNDNNNGLFMNELSKITDNDHESSMRNNSTADHSGGVGSRGGGIAVAKRIIIIKDPHIEQKYERKKKKTLDLFLRQRSGNNNTNNNHSTTPHNSYGNSYAGSSDGSDGGGSTRSVITPLSTHNSVYGNGNKAQENNIIEHNPKLMMMRVHTHSASTTRDDTTTNSNENNNHHSQRSLNLYAVDAGDTSHMGMEDLEEEESSPSPSVVVHQDNDGNTGTNAVPHSVDQSKLRIVCRFDGWPTPLIIEIEDINKKNIRIEDGKYIYLSVVVGCIENLYETIEYYLCRYCVGSNEDGYDIHHNLNNLNHNHHRNDGGQHSGGGGGGTRPQRWKTIDAAHAKQDNAQIEIYVNVSDGWREVNVWLQTESYVTQGVGKAMPKFKEDLIVGARL